MKAAQGSGCLARMDGVMDCGQACRRLKLLSPSLPLPHPTQFTQFSLGWYLQPPPPNPLAAVPYSTFRAARPARLACCWRSHYEWLLPSNPTNPSNPSNPATKRY